MSPFLSRFLRPSLTRFGLLAAGLFCFSDAFATTVIPPDFAQLVNESDYVVRGVVRTVNSEFQGRKIITKVEVEVLEVIVGMPPEKVVLETLGGRVGEDELVVEGAPKFHVGDENIFFVSGNGRNVSPLFGMKHGQYPIEREATTGKRFVSRSNKIPLESTAEVSQPMTEGGAAATQPRAKSAARALTPEQFAQEIKSAVNPAYHAKTN